MFDDQPTASKRLDDDLIGWLTTVDGDGTPRPSPVWFLVEGETVLVYSKAGTSRLANLEHRPRVSLNLDGNGRGGGIVIIEGTAVVDDSAPPADRNPPYVAKYGAMIERNGWTPQGFAADYPVPVRIRPGRLRAW